jgi:hypothetical protein
MIKMKRLLILMAAMAVVSCNNNNKNTATSPVHKKFKDSLSYTYQTVKERSTDCGNKPDSGCTVAQFAYPVFKDRPTLNDTVNSTLVYFFNSDKHPDTSLKDCALLFLQAYYYSKKSHPANAPAFKLDSYTRILSQDSSLTTISASVFIHMGIGAGHTIIRFINWDRTANKKLLLNDLLVDGYQDRLSKMAESIFRINAHLSDTASLQPNYHFRNNKFWLTDNYVITPDGLLFYYNKFQISLSGPIEILLPYDRLKPLMKTKTVLSQFIKQ